MEGEPVAEREIRLGEQGQKHRLIADERDRIEGRGLREGEFDARYDLGGTEVAAHGVDRDTPRGT